MPVVEGVGVAFGHGLRDSDPVLVDRLQAAMTAAIEKFQADGIIDVEKQRALILAARDAVLRGDAAGKSEKD